MASRVRCKACGFIMPEGAYDVCPACGMPSKVFEPYDDKVPENRRRWLDMHIHPVIVHAPQALGFLLLILAALYVVLVQRGSGSSLSAVLLPTLQVMSIVLPITVLAAIVSGLIDGKVRYKRLDTILLRRKIILGVLFLVFSLPMGYLALQPGFTSAIGPEIFYILLSAGAFVCSIFLGMWGSSLTPAVMPGPFPKKKSRTKT